MLEASAAEILRRVPESASVLDVGGWARPFTRADWVLDLMPYETRGMLGSDGPAGAERFEPATWVQWDICERRPWPFDDDQFDFAVCAHTLEDVRDPIWVCSELSRVARAGYVEVPSRLEEQTYGVEGPWVGWSHHRWFVDLEDGGLSFVAKSHTIHKRRDCHFPFGFAEQLSAEERVTALWWDGGIAARERIFMEPLELDGYLREFVARGRRGRKVPSRALGVARLVADRLRLPRWDRRRRSA